MNLSLPHTFFRLSARIFSLSLPSADGSGNTSSENTACPASATLCTASHEIIRIERKGNSFKGVGLFYLEAEAGIWS